MLWTEFFNKNISDIPDARDFTKEIDQIYKKLKWFEVYDLIEFLINENDEYHRNKLSGEFNKILEEYNSPCRVVNGLIQEISNKESVEMLTDSIEKAPNDIIKNHLKEAEKLYSNRKNTNFKSSCLTSINAVEACLRYFFLKRRNSRR